MYKLFKALHHTNHYCIVQDYIGLNTTNQYVCLYTGGPNRITIYIQNSIWHKRCSVSLCRNYYIDSCSYDEVLNLIDVVIKYPKCWNLEILEFLNCILINWDLN